jgi:predicted DNA-binding transcriptional regulator AlpA
MKHTRAPTLSSTADCASVEPEELIGNDKAAKMLGLAPQTLVTWRSEKHGPRFLKVGRLVYYRRTDISAWLAAQLRDPQAA